MKIVSRTLLLIGVGIIGFALFANHFGFDKDNNWGIGRILLLLLGIIYFNLLGLLIISWENPGESLLFNLTKAEENLPRPFRIFRQSTDLSILVIHQIKGI